MSKLIITCWFALGAVAPLVDNNSSHKPERITAVSTFAIEYGRLISQRRERADVDAANVAMVLVSTFSNDLMPSRCLSGSAGWDLNACPTSWS